jgi:hypothetical protein
MNPARRPKYSQYAGVPAVQRLRVAADDDERDPGDDREHQGDGLVQVGHDQPRDREEDPEERGEAVPLDRVVGLEAIGYLPLGAAGGGDSGGW